MGEEEGNPNGDTWQSTPHGGDEEEMKLWGVFAFIGATATTFAAMKAALGHSKDYSLEQYLLFVEKLLKKSKLGEPGIHAIRCEEGTLEFSY